MLLEVGHDTVDDVRLRSEEIECIDIAICWPSIGDLLDVWSKSGFDIARHSVVHGAILVMFSFSMVSSSITLSRRRLLSGSTTSTFHCFKLASVSESWDNRCIVRRSW